MSLLMVLSGTGSLIIFDVPALKITGTGMLKSLVLI